MRKLLLVLACTSLAACSGGGSPSKVSGGDKAVCGAFQKVADALVAQDGPRAQSALSGLKVVAASATTPALKAHATGLAAAKDGAAAARFGQEIVVDCKSSGHPLTEPGKSPKP